MRRSIHPALAAGVIAAVGLTAGAATLSRHGTSDHLVSAVAPAMRADITAAVPAAASAAAAVARSNPAPEPAVNSAPAAREPMAAGMVVAVDPETGKLGMPAAGQLGQELSIEEAQAYAHQIAGELVTERHPDGSSSLKHDDRLADYTVVRIGADGELIFQCVHGTQAAEAALRNDQQVQPAQEVK